MSTQEDENTDYHTHLIPKDALNKIRTVNIHFSSRCIFGFSFFDKDVALIWKIGVTTGSGSRMETVMLAGNEVIVGVVAKLYPGEQSSYTDF
jgi:hypothetical protein